MWTVIISWVHHGIQHKFDGSPRDSGTVQKSTKVLIRLTLILVLRLLGGRDQGDSSQTRWWRIRRRLWPYYGIQVGTAMVVETAPQSFSFALEC